jgi:hypothetical protein
MKELIITLVLVIVTDDNGAFPKGFEYQREHRGDLTCAQVMQQETDFLASYGSEGDKYCLIEARQVRPVARDWQQHQFLNRKEP